jgi:hypothetical protein
LGAETDVTAAGVRWLSPLPLWTGVLAGPVVFAIDLTASYALVGWACRSRQFSVLHGITGLSVLAVIAGAWICWRGFQHTRDVSDDGGRPRERARFMTLLGLTVSAFFLLAILANDMPRWVLHGCR